MSKIQLETVDEQWSDTITNHWAEDGQFKAQGLHVSHTESHDFPAYTVRSFILKNKGNATDRLIKQFHFTSWNDFRNPKDIFVFLSFIKMINKWNERSGGTKVSVSMNCATAISLISFKFS